MRGKLGELLLQFGALALRAFGCLGTEEYGLELLAATFAKIFENGHKDWSVGVANAL